MKTDSRLFRKIEDDKRTVLRTREGMDKIKMHDITVSEHWKEHKHILYS